jgi:hypothetical protein
MANDTPLPPELPSTACLDRPYSSRNQKGGTLIAEDIRTLEDHERTLAHPELVRPNRCRRCGANLHVHDRKERKPRGWVGGPPELRLLIFRCSRKECGAVWRILPRFLARCLWRTWETVGKSLKREEPTRHIVPERTQRRFWERLAEGARVIVTLLGESGVAELVERAMELGVRATRLGVVESMGGLGSLCEAARLCHRLEPGVRIM